MTEDDLRGQQLDKQAALAAIPDLEIGDVLAFFGAKATPRDHQIRDMLETNDELECDYSITSEGSDNGAWVLTWSWVSFADTALDTD